LQDIETLTFISSMVFLWLELTESKAVCALRSYSTDGLVENLSGCTSLRRM